jgi:putative phage-type endonuclease
MEVDRIERLQIRRNSKEWLEQRSTYLGGTDIAAILGLHPYKTPRIVYMEKKGLATPPELNQPMLHGINLEAYIARLYRLDTGRRLRKSRFRRDSEIPFFAANPDYDVIGESRLLECKTAGAWAGQEFGAETDAVPNQYLVQCMWQLMVTGREVCDLGVLIGGQDYRTYEIPRDEELIATLRQKAESWWNQYIVNDQAPPITGERADTELVKQQYPTNMQDCAMYAPPDVEELMAELREYTILQKKVDERVDRCKNAIKEHMGDYGELHGEPGVISWKCDKNGKRAFRCQFREEQICLSQEQQSTAA